MTVLGILPLMTHDTRIAEREGHRVAFEDTHRGSGCPERGEQRQRWASFAPPEHGGESAELGLQTQSRGRWLTAATVPEGDTLWLVLRLLTERR